ncbi:MAG: 23S rRNA (guanosine(2251)-2'-O)-methyltransferase RlmB [Dethiobacteria bacterium]|jgi:23S rRNA (guanosine2251-2'-O)-methyltransferase|nr:23S rRNA (guanosine(2251)-2'-O)-methyltransferase RlmB [Bacillota bacterium]
MKNKEQEMVYGRRPVAEALQAGLVNRLFLQRGIKGKIVEQLIEMVNAQGIPWYSLETEKFRLLAKGFRQHQGVLAYLEPYSYTTPENLLERAVKLQEKPFLLILDHIQDPGNFGSLLRTAEAVGVHGVVIPSRRAVGITAVVYKAASGALSHIPVARVVNLVQTVKYLKKQGLWIFGSEAESQDTAPYYKGDFSVPLALIIGSEGKGISPLVRKNCDFLLSIPMRGKVSSLNAGVAGALLMYEVFRCRAGWQV